VILVADGMALMVLQKVLHSENDLGLFGSGKKSHNVDSFTQISGNVKK